MPTPIREGQTATSKDGKSRVVFRGGQWTKDTSYRPPAATRPQTTADDRKALAAASARSATERDAMRQYDSVGRAVSRISGPAEASYLEAITPRPDGDWKDTLGGILGIPLRWMVSDKTLSAMDQMNTVSAQTALKGSQQMKGSSSDKDTALMRMAGVGPYKSQAENRRLLEDARYQSGVEQERANSTAYWIGKHGSLSAPAPNGTTFEQYLRGAEGRYAQAQAARRRPLPKAPPKRSGPVTIDMNGNPTR